MALSRRNGKPFDVTYNIDCIYCGGLVGHCPQYDIEATIKDHFKLIHPETRLIAEGVQYTSYEAPMHCDACNVVVEKPWWSHISDPPTTVGPTVDSDGLWLVCQPCHDLYVARDLVGLVRRHWSIAKEQTPGMTGDRRIETAIKAVTAQKFRLLFERWDEGVLET